VISHFDEMIIILTEKLNKSNAVFLFRNDNNYDCLVPWMYPDFVMFESKSHPDNFLGCTKDGVAQLLHIQDKWYPNPRALFIINEEVNNSGGN